MFFDISNFRKSLALSFTVGSSTTQRLKEKVTNKIEAEQKTDRFARRETNQNQASWICLLWSSCELGAGVSPVLDLLLGYGAREEEEAREGSLEAVECDENDVGSWLRIRVYP